MKTIIVGAGTSGLGALHTLKKAGADVVCLEAGSFAGGRIFSRRKNGYIFDPGAQFFFHCYHTYVQLIEEFGLTDDLTSVPFVAGLPRTSDRVPSPVHASIKPKDLWNSRDMLLKFRGVSIKSLLQLIPLLPTFVKHYKDFGFTDYDGVLDMDSQSLAEFALSKGGSDILERVLQPVAACMTLGEPEEIGAGYGLALVWNCINGLRTLKHGIGSLSEAIYEKYQDDIKLNTPVTRIVIEDGKVKGVETAEGFMEADRVICSTTATKALNLMPNLPDTISGPLKTVNYSSCCHVMFALRNQVLPNGWYAVALPRIFGSTMAGFTDSYIKSPYYVPTGGGLINCFTYSHYAKELNAMPDEKVIPIMIKDIQQWTPNMPDEPLFTEIVRFDEAVCTAAPGMLRAISNMKKNHANDVKGLHIAGEYIFMPSVEGATHSGICAAKDILNS